MTAAPPLNGRAVLADFPADNGADYGIRFLADPVTPDLLDVDMWDDEDEDGEPFPDGPFVTTLTLDRNEARVLRDTLTAWLDR